MKFSYTRDASVSPGDHIVRAQYILVPHSQTRWFGVAVTVYLGTINYINLHVCQF